MFLPYSLFSFFFFFKSLSDTRNFPAPSERVGGAKEAKYLFLVPLNRLIFRVLFEWTE